MTSTTNTSTINMSISGGTDGAQAQGLLAALANFVKPIVYECMSSDTKREELMRGCGLDMKTVENQFVSCLKTFIAETVNECRIMELTRPSTPNLNDIPSPTNLVSEQLNIIKDTDRPRVIPLEFRDMFKSHVLKIIRFDLASMPTRLLTFDLTGLHIRLMDHREASRFIAEIALSDMEICTLDFLPELIEDFKNDPTGQILDLKFYFSTPPNASKTKIHEFIKRYTRYAILSHTWKQYPSGEINYQDWVKGDRDSDGDSKINNFCQVSARNGMRLGWVDTCCINKESSAELDEAIRSMYNWYQRAALCVVHLSGTKNMDDMERDLWFTRGWTLQELLAPRKMVVYNMHWKALDCDKKAVAAAARIQTHEIEAFERGHPEEIPISRRLQMSCMRQVTREEDMAYSLMGILGVNIPIAYGEGSRRAFSRLMREIITTTRDVMDIFNHGYYEGNSNLIPSTVYEYRNRSKALDQRPRNLTNDIPSHEPLLLTHVGLRVPLLLVPSIHENYYAAPLTGTYLPMGGLYGQVWDYNLLDRLFDSGRNLCPHAMLFEIVNFSVQDGQARVQNTSISIPLDCRGLGRGIFDSYYSLKTSFSYVYPHPPVLTLRSSEDPDGNRSEITVVEDMLKLHGLLRKTLYL